MKFSGEVGNGLRNYQLDFGSDGCLDSGSFLKDFLGIGVILSGSCKGTNVTLS